MPLGAFKAALMGTAGVEAGADVVLLATQTASNSASITFSSDITSTYVEYIFKFYNINPATDQEDFTFQVNAADSSSYDEYITSANFRTYHQESGGAADLVYQAPQDQAQGQSYQIFMHYLGNAADESASGELHLFNPSSTTYVKHFYSEASVVDGSTVSTLNHYFVGGYINQTKAIDDIQFKMSSGNFDGTIKMWGVK